MHGMEQVKLNIHNQISQHKGAPVNSKFFRNLAVTFITACYTRMGNPVTLRTNVWCLFTTYRQRRWSHVLRLSRRQNSIKIFSSWRQRQVVQTHQHSTDRLHHQVYCIRTMVMAAVSETLVVFELPDNTVSKRRFYWTRVHVTTCRHSHRNVWAQKEQKYE